MLSNKQPTLYPQILCSPPSPISRCYPCVLLDKETQKNKNTKYDKPMSKTKLKLYVRYVLLKRYKVTAAIVANVWKI